MTGMTHRRLLWTLRARGPALHDWPPAERASALDLVRRSDPARQALADALAAEDAPATDHTALRRILRHVHDALAPPPPLLRGIRLSAMAACVAAGLYAGLAPAEAEQPLAPSVQTVNPAVVLAALDL